MQRTATLLGAAVTLTLTSIFAFAQPAAGALVAPAAPTPSAAPAVDGPTYAVRLRDLEARIEELKELKLRESFKRRLVLAQCTVKGGRPSWGARPKPPQHPGCVVDPKKPFDPRTPMNVELVETLSEPNGRSLPGSVVGEVPLKPSHPTSTK